jgi:hypothetical protein
MIYKKRETRLMSLVEKRDSQAQVKKWILSLENEMTFGRQPLHY